MYLLEFSARRLSENYKSFASTLARIAKLNPSDYSHGEDGSSSAATSNQRKALMLHSD